MKIKQVIPLILLALFSSFIGINQVSAGNANVAGHWFLSLTPSNMNVKSVGIFTDGTVTTLNLVLPDLIAVTPYTVKQASDGTLSGSLSISASGITAIYTLTGKVTGNTVTFTNRYFQNPTAIGYTGTSTWLGNFTGTISNGTISGTFQDSYSANADLAGRVSITYTGQNSGSFLVEVTSGGGGGGGGGGTAKPANPGIDYHRGQSTDFQTTVGDPIDSVTGNMHIINPDLSLPGRALKFDFIRTYNNQEKVSGPLGYGWTHSYNVYLSLDTATGLTKIKDEQAKGYLFSDKGGGTYLSQRGDYSTLVKTYTTKKVPTGYLWRKKDGKQYIFDLTGKLIQVKDRNSNTISLSYDSGSNLTSITDTVGRVINLTYSPSKLLTRLTDFSGRHFDYAYDASGNLISVTDPLGNSTTYQYDSNHNITKKTNAKGDSVYFTYDSSNRCTSSTGDANNGYTALSFDQAQSKTTITDSKNNQTTHYYNSDYLITKVVNPQAAQILSTWDSNLNLTSRTDELGHTTSMSYDSMGNLIKVTDALGNITSFTYETLFNQPTSSTDALANKTTYTYDKCGNLTKATDPSGGSISYTYSIYGLPITSTNQLSKKTYFGYDTYGNLTLTKDPLNAITYFSYDSVGNLIQAQDPKNNLTKFSYDSLNRLIKTTHADNFTLSYGYDAVGNRTSLTDQKGFTTYYTYNQNNKVTSTTDPLAKTTNYNYDTEGNLSSVRDQNNNTTSFSYDSLNRLILKTDALGYKTQYQYDAAGNRISLTDPKAQTTASTYDSLNRLTKVAYPDLTIQYSYDALARRTSMVDSLGTTTYAYDKVGRLLTQDGPLANDTLTYTYDKAGNRLSLTDPDKKTTKYTYDSLNRILTLTDPQKKITKYTYDSVGNITTLVYPNFTQTTYIYDNLKRLTKLTTSSTKKPYTVLNQFSYTYDPSGRRIQVNLIDGSITYGYDQRGELTQENRTSTSSTYQITYQYDPAGNRISMNKNNQQTNYSYNSLNQLTSEQTSGIGQTNYTYDANGNLTKKGVSPVGGLSLSYDSQNHLIRVTGSGIDESYQYDGEGKRVAVQTNSSTTSYLYDGLNVITERNTSGSTNYIRNPQAAGGIGSIIKTATQGVSPKGSVLESYYHYDGLGSVTNLTNSTGSSTQTYTYDAFGQGLSPQGTVPDPNTHKFLTKETDSTGLIYFGARYYDPRLGRFITPDPSGMVDGPNLYLYCLNDPVNAVDLWGLCVEKPWWNNLWNAISSTANNFINTATVNIGVNVGNGQYGYAGGILIAPNGVFVYGGKGAYGLDVTATANFGSLPNVGPTFVGSVSGGDLVGGKYSVSTYNGRTSTTAGGGLGLGYGGSAGVVYTIELWPNFRLK